MPGFDDIYPDSASGDDTRSFVSMRYNPIFEPDGFSLTSHPYELDRTDGNPSGDASMHPVNEPDIYWNPNAFATDVTVSNSAHPSKGTLIGNGINLCLIAGVAIYFAFIR